MRVIRARLKLWMKLRADEPRMVSDLDDLHETVIGQCSRDVKSRALKLGTKIVVELIAVTMTFTDFLLPVSGEALRTLSELARIGAEAHRATLVLDILLRKHEVDDRVFRLVTELRRVGIRHAADVTRELDDGTLHAQTKAEERNAVLPRILHGANLSLDAAVPAQVCP